MSNIKIFFGAAVLVVFFSSGVKMGKLYERAKVEKAMLSEKKELQKRLDHAIIKKDEFRQKAIILEHELKLKPGKVIEYVEKVVENSNCDQLGDAWRIMHNEQIQRFENNQFGD